MRPAFATRYTDYFVVKDPSVAVVEHRPPLGGVTTFTLYVVAAFSAGTCEVKRFAVGVGTTAYGCAFTEEVAETSVGGLHSFVRLGL
jgi:hypothetical protein